MSENTAIVAAKPKPPSVQMNGRGVVLRNLDEAYRFATAVHLSGLAPKSFTKPEAILIAMQYGAELALSPMQSLANIAVINGKACIYGDGLKAVVEGSAVCEWIKERVSGDGDNMVAVCEAKRVGRPEPTVRTFSTADAKRAGLWMKKGRNGEPGPWCLYPQRMLQMRARAWCLRDQFADLLCGMGVAEEVLDMEPLSSGLQSGDVTPASDLDEIVGQMLEAPQTAPQATTEPIQGDVEEDPAIGALFDTSPEPEVYA